VKAGNLAGDISFDRVLYIRANGNAFPFPLKERGGGLADNLYLMCVQLNHGGGPSNTTMAFFKSIDQKGTAAEACVNWGEKRTQGWKNEKVKILAAHPWPG